jgi:hypothetical protein
MVGCRVGLTSANLINLFIMRRSKRLSLFFFIIGFCSCLFLTGVVRYISDYDWSFFSFNNKETAIFHAIGECDDCKKISTRFWKIGRLKDNHELHLESARRMGIDPFESNEALEKGVVPMLRRGKLEELEDGNTYRLKNLTHSYPYVVPETADLLDEIGKRFQNKLDEMGIKPYYLMISSVLRTVESQNGLGRRNSNATRSVSSHIYGTSFDISYKEFLPPHGKSAPEGYCRHDMMRHPLAEVLTEMSAEGKCRVVREVKQACFHITVCENRR